MCSSRSRGQQRASVRWLALSILLAGAPAPAFAHPAVERGIELYREGRFDAALDAFRQAEDADDLSRADLVGLLEARALIHHGQRRSDALAADLVRLASLDPAHEFAPEVPPDVVEAFLRARAGSGGALELHAEPHAAGGSVRIVVEVENDAGSLVREVRIHSRISEGAWRTLTGRELTLDDAAAEVEFYAEAIGPGGAVVATAGSRRDPLRTAGSSGAPSVLAPPPDSPPRDDGGPRLTWLWISLAVAAVVAGGVAVGLVLSDRGGNDVTRPGPPTVRGF